MAPKMKFTPPPSNRSVRGSFKIRSRSQSPKRAPAEEEVAKSPKSLRGPKHATFNVDIIAKSGERFEFEVDLNAKWQARSVQQSLVIPALKSINQGGVNLSRVQIKIGGEEVANPATDLCKTFATKANGPIAVEMHVPIEYAKSMRFFDFEDGPLGMRFDGFVNDEGYKQGRASARYAVINVAGVTPDSQADKLGVRAGAIIKTVGTKDVTKVLSMNEVVKMIKDAPRPFTIAMDFSEAKATEEEKDAAAAEIQGKLDFLAKRALARKAQLDKEAALAKAAAEAAAAKAEAEALGAEARRREQEQAEAAAIVMQAAAADFLSRKRASSYVSNFVSSDEVPAATLRQAAAARAMARATAAQAAAAAVAPMHIRMRIELDDGGRAALVVHHISDAVDREEAGRRVLESHAEAAARRRRAETAAAAQRKMERLREAEDVAEWRRQKAAEAVQRRARGAAARREVDARRVAREAKRMAAATKLQAGARMAGSIKSVAAKRVLEQAQAAKAASEQLEHLATANLANARARQSGVYVGMAALLSASKQVQPIRPPTTVVDQSDSLPRSARLLHNAGLQAGVLGRHHAMATGAASRRSS